MELVQLNDSCRTIYAKTGDRSRVGLVEHSAVTAFLFLKLAMKDKLPERFLKLGAFASLNHDIGKRPRFCQRFFQGSASETETDYQLSSKGGVKTPWHSELGWIMLAAMNTRFPEIQRDSLNKIAEWAVLYHHAPQIYYDGSKKGSKVPSVTSSTSDILARLPSNCLKDGTLIEWIDFCCCLNESFLPRIGYNFERPSSNDVLDVLLGIDTGIPSLYFSRSRLADTKDQLRENAFNHLVKKNLVLADRISSSLMESDAQRHGDLFKQLDEFKDFDDLLGKLDRLEPGVLERNTRIKQCAINFGDVSKKVEVQDDDSERTILQKNLVSQLYSKTTSIVSAPAGSGKTRIALLTYLKQIDSGKRLIWVTPRNDVAAAVYSQIIQELSDMGFSDKNYSVEAYYTGKKQMSNRSMQDLTSNIIILNIDSILNPNLYHSKIEQICMTYDSIVVFDEFHELADRTPLFSGFIIFMIIRHYILKEKTILLSATPLPLSEFWDLDSEDKTFLSNSLKFWHEQKFTFKFRRGFDHLLKCNEGTVFFNSVANATTHHIRRKSNVLIHGRMGREEKNRKFLLILESLGKEAWSKPNKPSLSISCCHSIQAGVNIASKPCADSLRNPLDTLQRAGRNNRFGLGDDFVFLAVDAYDNRGETQLRNGILTKELCQKWIDMLFERFGEESEIIIQDLYDIYEEYFDNYRSEISDALESNLELSLGLANEINYKMKVKNTPGPRKTSSGNFRDPKAQYNIVYPIISVQKDGLLSLEKDREGRQLFMLDSREARTPFQVPASKAWQQAKLVSKLAGEQGNLKKRNKYFRCDFRFLDAKRNNLSSYMAENLSPNLLLSRARNEDAPLFLNFAKVPKESQGYEDASFYFVDKEKHFGIFPLKKIRELASLWKNN